MKQITVTLDDALLERAQDEATRSCGGQLDAAVTAALRYYLPLRESGYDLNAQATAGGVVASLPRIRGVLTDRGVSADTLTALAAMLTGLATDGPPHPGEIANWLKPFLDWCTADPQSHLVGAVLVSAQAAGGKVGTTQAAPPASYALGWLRGDGQVISGDLQQFFSDRSPKGTTNPFDPSRSESVGLLLALEAITGLTTCTLTAHAWGDAKQTLSELRVSDGMLLARAASVGNQTDAALCALSLFTTTAPE